MEKVEAYRCEECNGTGKYHTAYGAMLNQVEHPKCKGTGIVWLTEEEVENEG